MKTLLRIDSSIRLSKSYTRILTGYFESAWLNANPNSKVIRRCLVNDKIPHLTQETLEGFSDPYNPSSNSTLSDQLIAELKKADHLLIGSPLYNLSLPSTLKAYFDHVVRSTATFEVKESVYHGLLRNVSATVITARSGVSSIDYVDDYQTSYLKSVLNFMGIGSVDVVALESTGLDCGSALSNAKQTIDDFFINHKEPEWVGEFCDREKHEISQIRSAQATAIIEGNAARYANLCTDDIQLLIPSCDMVSGIEDFLKVEKILFSKAIFEKFIKHPVRIERNGDLAVEVGRQEVVMKNQHDNQGVFTSSQKYTHVYRKTANGWRFAVLMSNSSE